MQVNPIIVHWQMHNQVVKRVWRFLTQQMSKKMMIRNTLEWNNFATRKQK